MARQGYSAEFRRKVLDRLADGHSVASVAHDLDLSDQTIYNWRRQDRIDRGLELANAIFEYLEIWHNRKRRHSQLGWLTPLEFERNRITTVA